MTSEQPEPDHGFVAPNFRREIDLEAQIRLLPPRATCKGLFFSDLISRAQRAAPGVDLAKLAGVSPKTYTAFLDYPHEEWMRITYAAASVIPEGQQHVGEGLRHLGCHAFEAMFNHPLGKVIFGPLGLRMEQIVAHGPLAYRVALGFGKIAARRLDDRHYRYTFEGFPTFLETFNVGVLQGGIERNHGKPRVLIRLDSLAACEMDVSWS